MAPTSTEKTTTQKRVLNLRAVAIIVGSITMLSVLLSWLHATQVQRTSDFLKTAAEQAVADNEPNRAFDLYEQYLILNPDDMSAEEQISMILDEHGGNPKSLVRSFQINERLLLADKSRDDLRLRQISIAARLRRYSDAAVHLKTLRDKRTDLSEVWHFSGIVAQDTGDYPNAQKYFEKAVALENPVAESFGYLADLQTEQTHDPEAAEQTLNRMIQQLNSTDAYRIRAVWLQKQERHIDAMRDLWTVLQNEPSDVRANAMLLKAIRIAAGKNHQFPAQQHYQKIIRHLTQALENEPDEPQLRLYLSSALWAVNDRRSSIENLKYGIDRDPREYSLQEVLVDYLITDRQFDAARQLFEGIPERVIDRGRRSFTEGRLLMAQEQWLPAIAAFDTALSFAGGDHDIASRSRICLALCRREAGDSSAELETYRSLVKSDPDSERGRLGMASAYLRSNQLELAIAEYRQLLHVDGVPEFLANLLIKQIMKQPPRNRDWSDVEALVTNETPIIADEVQRILLQADLRFAQGFPSQALDILDRAAQRMPDREEIQRALQRVSSVHSESLNKRVMAVLQEDPSNMDAHVSVLRLQLNRRDTADMVQWLNRFFRGDILPDLDRTQRLQIIAQATTIVAESESATRADREQFQVLLQFSAEAWKRLSESSPQHLTTYIRFLGRYRSVDYAMTEISRAAANASPVIQARCWLECLRRGADDPQVSSQVQQALSDLISSDSGNSELRLVYADALIAVDRYDDAETLLVSLAKSDRFDGRSLGRLAWLKLLVRSDALTALQLSEQAILRSPGDTTVRSVRGLVLAENGNTDQALDVLRSIPAADRTTSSFLYEARSLFLTGNTSAAAAMIRDLGRKTHDLAAVEQRMMQSLQQKLKIESPRMTSR